MDPFAELRQRLAGVDDPLGLLVGFFAHAPVGLQIYRADGHSLVVNDAFRTMFGSEPPPEYNVLRDEVAVRNGILDLIHRAFRGETITLPPTWYDPRELDHVKVEEGKRVAIVATFFPIVDARGTVRYIAITFQDQTIEITERERFRAILDQLPIGVVAATTSGITLFNNAAVRMLPRLAEDLPVEHKIAASGLREPDGTPLLTFSEMPGARAARGERLHNHELRLGEDRWVLVNSAPRLSADGQVVEGISTLTDITDQKRIEERVQALSAVKDEFLGIASHELRTPLTAMRASVQVATRRLAGHESEPAVRGALEALSRAQRQVDRMARLVDELLDGARIERGHLEIDRQRVDLREVVRSECEDASDSERIELALPDAPVFCALDEGRIAEVFSNLLSNALRHGASNKPVEVRLERAGADALLQVRDHGRGIDPADLPGIFQRFYRGKMSRGTGGLGLGLYIASEIAKLHGGALTAESAPGSGAVFTLTLPLDEDH